MLCHRQESNLQLLVRTELFYPLNYGGDFVIPLDAQKFFDLGLIETDNHRIIADLDDWHAKLSAFLYKLGFFSWISGDIIFRKRYVIIRKKFFGHFAINAAWRAVN